MTLGQFHQQASDHHACTLLSSPPVHSQCPLFLRWSPRLPYARVPDLFASIAARRFRDWLRPENGVWVSITSLLYGI